MGRGRPPLADLPAPRVPHPADEASRPRILAMSIDLEQCFASAVGHNIFLVFADRVGDRVEFA